MCPVCEGNHMLYTLRTTIEVADDPSRWMVLLQCGVCRQYFDYAPTDRQLPEPLTRDEARTRYPGAVPLSDEPDDGGPRL